MKTLQIALYLILEHLNFLCMGLGRREDFGRQGRKRRQCCSLPSISNAAGQSRNRHKPYIKNLIVLTALLTIPALAAKTGEPADSKKKKRAISQAGQLCLDCHSKHNKGLFADWANSRHAQVNVTCIDCHKTSSKYNDVSAMHADYSKTPVTAIVSPKDCSRCHYAEAKQYDRSKHANTLELIWKIDGWLNDGMNNEIERTTGCYTCHGTDVKIKDGKFDPLTWPNVGVGRLNPDGSKGSCSSCHTRHKFSIEEARKPEACGQCHLGPDHPQIEIYKESKHGAIYDAEGHTWKWDSPSKDWTPGVDYRTPTCSTCHMSAINGVKATHDVTERLAWETQAPLTVRPNEFKPWPAKTDPTEERNKMKDVCLACHSQAWTNGHFDRLDAAIQNYNEVYYKPTKKLIDGLYEKKLLSKDKPLDEHLEVQMYELWHHEGRRARFGAAMMAPDYAWWHGFYEMKKRCMEIEEEVEELIKSKKPAKRFDVKGTGGSTKKPDFAK